MIFGAADLHLTKYVWTERKDIKGDSAQAFLDVAKAIVDGYDQLTIEKHLILAGDIFDKNKVDGFTNKNFSNIMHYLHSSGVTVYYIQGNHDLEEDPLPSAIQEGYDAIPIHMDGQGIMDIDGKRVVGIDYGSRREMLEKINAITEPVDILVLHCAFKHLLSFEDSYSLSMEDIPANYRNVFVGDIHITDATKGLASGGFVISPGPTHACQKSQDEPKGFMILDDLDNPKFHEIDYRRIYHDILITDKDLEDFEKKLQTTYSNVSSKYDPIVDVMYPNNMEGKMALLMNKYDSFKYFTTPVRHTSVLKQVEIVYNHATLISALPAVMDEKDPDYTFMEGLLTGNAEVLIEEELEVVL
jgi:DNA repair exonuclease SbcCD nuclease subunit